MQHNPVLKKAILEVVDNQLRDDDPPETRLTLERLMQQGISEEEAKKYIGCVVTSESFDVLKNGETFDQQRYETALRRLPTLPWE